MTVVWCERPLAFHPRRRFLPPPSIFSRRLCRSLWHRKNRQGRQDTLPFLVRSCRSVLFRTFWTPSNWVSVRAFRCSGRGEGEATAAVAKCVQQLAMHQLGVEKSGLTALLVLHLPPIFAGKVFFLVKTQLFHNLYISSRLVLAGDFFYSTSDHLFNNWPKSNQITSILV